MRSDLRDYTVLVQTQTPQEICVRREPIWPLALAWALLFATLAILAATTRMAPAQASGEGVVFYISEVKV